MLLIVVALVAFPRIARAGVWYYAWSCAGDCAPDQLAIEGREGPFATYEECDAARSSDWRGDYFLAPGNLGGLDFCEEVGDDTSGDSSYVASSSSSPGSSGSSGSSGSHHIPLARVAIAAVAGPSYRVSGEEATGETGGVELGLQFGGRPELGLEMSLGLHYSRVTAPRYGADPKPMMFVPWMAGLVISPALSHGRREVRLDLAADAGLVLRVGCSTCSDEMLPTTWFAGEVRAGLDTYFDRSGGIGVDAVVMFGQEGTGDVIILPPALLVRLSLLVRSAR